MRSGGPNDCDPDPDRDRARVSIFDRNLEPQNSNTAAANPNSAENVLAEIGLVLAAALGIVLAVNAALQALQIG